MSLSSVPFHLPRTIHGTDTFTLAAKTHSASFPDADIIDGSFTFACRTSLLDLSSTHPSTSTSTSSSSQQLQPKHHSYPPPPSPRESIASTSSTSSTLVDHTNPPPPRRPNPNTSSVITHFLITPEPLLPHPAAVGEQPIRGGGGGQNRFSGMLSHLGKKLVGASKRVRDLYPLIAHLLFLLHVLIMTRFFKSFTIRVPAVTTSPSSSTTSMLTLLTFHDTTPTFTLGAPTSGLIEMDDGITRLLGVDRGFYVAVCLAFLQFLEDKEVCSSDSDRGMK